MLPNAGSPLISNRFNHCILCHPKRKSSAIHSAHHRLPAVPLGSFYWSYILFFLPKVLYQLPILNISFKQCKEYMLIVLQALLPNFTRKGIPPLTLYYMVLKLMGGLQLPRLHTCQGLIEQYDYSLVMSTSRTKWASLTFNYYQARVHSFSITHTTLMEHAVRG